MRKIYSTLVLLFIASVLFAQENTELQKSEINKIKKNKNYIYGEATLENKDEAMQLAKELLLKNINEWVTSETKMKQSEAVVVRDITENSENINLMRGNMYRAFVYVQKKNILPVDNTKAAVVVSRSTGNDNEPTIVVTDIVRVEPQGVVESFQPVVNVADDSPEQVLQNIMSFANFKEAGIYLQQLKTERRMAYGSYATMTSPNECYLLVCNRNGEIVAVLDRGHQKNLKTQQDDGLKNYSDAAAIWFQVFQKN